MPENSSYRRDMNELIKKIALRDTLVFDPVSNGDDSTLESCGKCGVCGECVQCGKSADDLKKDLDILRKRIEVNPEILKDIKKRWDIRRQ